MALATIPGFYGLSGAGIGKPFGVHTSGLVSADLVPQHVAVLGGGRSVVDSVAPAGGGPVAAVVPDLPEVPSGETHRVPLGTILGSRSGDKGGNANLGVFARSIEAYAWMAQELTVERMRELLPEAAGLSIDRHELPNLWSLNFVIHGILQKAWPHRPGRTVRPNRSGSGSAPPRRHPGASAVTSLRDRLRDVPAPEPILSRAREAALTDRQREILDELGRIFDKGFVDVTMAELASQLNCSLRTLYGVAEGRNAHV